MANGFSSLTFTALGINLLAKAQTGTKLTFTRIAVGDGVLNGQDSTKFKALIDEVMSLDISTLVISGSGFATIGAVLDNSDLSTGFYWREIGIFATDPELGEILYGYANANGGEIYVPDKSTSTFTSPLNIGVYISNASSVTATIDSSLVYATKADISALETAVTARMVISDYAAGTGPANTKTVDHAIYANTSGNTDQRLDVIDGNFQISSIGASKSTSYTTAGYPIWDCWKYTRADTNCSLLWKSIIGEVAGSQYAAELLWSSALTAGTNNYRLSTFFEKAVSILCGYASLTFSFYAKADAEEKSLRLTLYQNYGSGGSPSSGNSQSQVIALTASWKRYTVTFTPVSIADKTFGTNNDDYLQLDFGIDGTIDTDASGNIQFTQVQLDIGSAALPYRNKSFTQELIACQRYYERSYSYGAPNGSVSSNGMLCTIPQNSVYSGVSYSFKVSKRCVPCMSIYDANGNCSHASPWQDSSSISVDGTTVGTESITQIYSNGGAFTSNVSLRFHFVADARY